MLKSRGARIVGAVLFALGLIKPVLEVIRTMLDVIGEGQTFGQVWPSIKTGLIAAYNAPPIWLNLTVVLIGGLLLYVSREPSQAQPQQSPSPLTTATEPTRETVIARPTTPAAQGSTPPAPAARSGFTAGELLTFLEAIKPIPGSVPPQIKFVAAPAVEDFAKFLARCVQVVGRQVIENPDNASFIFPARTKNSQIVIRYRQAGRGGMPGLIVSTSAMTIMASLLPLRLPLPLNSDQFPDNDRYNYIQIEVGGAL